jgi:hypothetical protein
VEDLKVGVQSEWLNRREYITGVNLFPFNISITHDRSYGYFLQSAHAAYAGTHGQ